MWSAAGDKDRKAIQDAVALRRTAKHRETVRWTWIPITRSASIWMPRSRADLTGLTRVPSTDKTEHGSWRCRRLVAHHTTSALSQFSDSRLDSIQLATAPTHSEIFDERASTAAGRQEPYTCVSSSYMCGDKPWLSITEIKSAVYIINSMGPKTDPVAFHT